MTDFYIVVMTSKKLIGKCCCIDKIFGEEFYNSGNIFGKFS